MQLTASATSTKREILDKVIEIFSLDTLSRPVDLNELAREFGVSSVEVDAISSEAMLIPSAGGYKIVLKKSESAVGIPRQRFSFAHELGHLLLRKLGYGGGSKSKPMHRNHDSGNDEEKLCDQIAAEILMPSAVFVTDAAKTGWELGGLGSLAKQYGTSIPATARRMIGLMPEPCVMGVWKPAAANSDTHILQQSFAPQSRYGVPSSTRLSRRRLWLIARASNSQKVESGILPLLDKNRSWAILPDVPADAWAWGREEFRRVMIFYYPERELTNDMLAVANATWRPL